MSQDPKRLIHDEQGALVDALQASKRNLPTDAQLESLAERLVRLGIPAHELPRAPNAPGPGPTIAAPSPRFSPLIKLGLASVGLGVVAVALLHRAQREAAPRSADAQLSSAPPQFLPAAQPPASSLPAVPRADSQQNVAPTSRAVRATTTATPEQENGARARLDSATTPEADASEPATKAARSKAVAPNVPLASSARSLAPSARPAAPSVANSSSKSASTAAARGAAPDADSEALPAAIAPDTEISLLKKARSALSADPLTAYGIAERCAREFPNGVFAQERDFITISALHRLGRAHEAKSYAASFRSRYPRSAYLPQLERMLGNE
jgi:hypothetical protein